MKLPALLAATSVAIAVSASASRASAPAPIVFAANRAPTLTGEIYRIDPSGKRVDLSKSLAQDTAPSVSPDGKHVAFLSDRLGGTSVWEVGIDGTHLRLFAPRARLQPYLASGIYWQPHGRHLAIGEYAGRVVIVHRFHQPVYVQAGVAGGSGTPIGSPWSPDGKVLATSTPTRIRVVNPQGKTVWTVAARFSNNAWSSTGLLALDGLTGVDVYDEAGHRLFEVAHATSFAWSPNGQMLAVNDGKTTTISTASGAFVRSVPGTEAGPWIDEQHVNISGFAYARHCTFLDIGSGSRTTHSCGNLFFAPRSADGKLAIVTPPAGRAFKLGVAPTVGGAVKRYAIVPGCASGNGGVEWGAAPAYLQFAGRTRSIVYQNWDTELCYPPQAELYSVQPDGSGLTRLTHVDGAMAPRVSPDGTAIAYVAYYPDPGMCGQSIKITTSSGAPVRDLADWDYYGRPAWSPDGSTLLDSGMSCGGDPHDSQLFTIPAGGGAPTYLHVRGTEVAWGPTRIAYVGAKGLTTADPDGSNRVVVAAHGVAPAWSPSGELAYFVGTSLVVGSNAPVQLPFARMASLEWTSDGSRLVFAAATTKDGELDLYSVAPDGTDLIRLTTNYGVLGEPDYPFS